MSRGRLAALAAMVLVGCGAAAQTAPYPISVQADPVPLDRRQPPLQRVDALAYAGGLSLRAKGFDAFGGVSGFDMEPDGRFVAVTDAGDLIRGRLALDADGRVGGLAEASLARLTDETGEPLKGKRAGDAEDITLLPDGGFAVSFEQDHRVLVYPRDGTPLRLAPPAGARLGPNRGLEALAYWRDPANGAERLVMGAERGDAWSCSLAGDDCRQVLVAARDNPGDGFGLTGLDALPDGGLVGVYRAVSLIGLRARVVRVVPGAERPVTVLARLGSGMNIDNLESVAAVPRADGSLRLYLVSDDNFSGWLRTLLLSFDWEPGPPQ